MKKRSSPPSRSHSDRPAPPGRGAGRPSRGPRGQDRQAPALPRLTIDLYGAHAVREAILNPLRMVRAIYATPDQADQVDEWVREAERQGLDRPGIHMPPREAFDAVLPREAVHQGIAVTCDPLPDVGLDDILRDLPDGPCVLVMLDQVTDPHNFGAIMRSACAFGAAAVVVQRRNAPDLSALIAKTACGAVEHIPVAYETNLARAIEQVKDVGFTVYGLDERGEQSIRDVKVPERSMIILGAEGPGMRRLIREGCDQLVRLPTLLPIASLNVSNAAAVTLYHFCAT